MPLCRSRISISATGTTLRSLARWSFAPLALGLTTLVAVSCRESVVEPFPTSVKETSVQLPGEGYPTHGDAHIGYMADRSGQAMRIAYETHDGHAFWQGDIDLGPASQIAPGPERVGGIGGTKVPAIGEISRGVSVSDASSRWPQGVVPYAIDATLASPQRVLDAIAAIQAVTSLRFVNRTSEVDYLRFVTSTGCSSYVGRIGGGQSVSLAPGCSTGNTMHEISHALGMQHEQTRCDRDDFVTVNYGNITAGYESNFGKLCDGGVDDGSYNEASIMHYPPTGFSKNGSPTITSKRGADALMGSRSTLAATDIATLATMYTTFVSITRRYNAATDDHFFTANPTEGSPSYTTEVANYFYLSKLNAPEYVPLYRCYNTGIARHFLSRDAGCDGASFEGAIGNIALQRLAGTTPLYRMRNRVTGKRHETVSDDERLALLRQNWVDEKTMGFVWVAFAPTARTPIHRLYSATLNDHVYGKVATEGAPSYATEAANYFFLETTRGNVSVVPLYRCYSSWNNRHYLSQDLYCDVGILAEQILGLASINGVSGTVPLYRAFNSTTSERIVTTSATELNALQAAGWIYDAFLGYAWTN